MPSAHILPSMIWRPSRTKCWRWPKTLGRADPSTPLFLHPNDRPTDGAGWTAFAERLAASVGERVRHCRPVTLSAGTTMILSSLRSKTALAPMELILKIGRLTSSGRRIWRGLCAGGADPFAWIDRYAARISLRSTLKDIAPDGECLDEDGWADVGEGAMPWADLLRGRADQNAGTRTLRDGARQARRTRAALPSAPLHNCSE